MRRAMYTFSADPITYGHLDIIKRIAKKFDELVVGIGKNAAKECTFSLEERLDMAGKSTARLSNVRVVHYDTMLVHYARRNGIDTIIKGIRNIADVDYEKIIHEVGRSQKLGIETFLLIASPEIAHISSSTVKAIQAAHGDIHEYVPLYVKQCLEAKISSQYIIGVTGEMGAGKSYITDRLKEFGDQNGISIHTIRLDDLGHYILGPSEDWGYVNARKEIIRIFGSEVQQKGGKNYEINRKVLAKSVFNDQTKLDELYKIMEPLILLRYYEELHDKQGLIAVESAIFAEKGLAYLCNNNIMMVEVDKASQYNRLAKKGFSKTEVDMRLANQYTFNQKKAKITEYIRRDFNGKIWLVNNGAGSDANYLNEIFRTIIKEVNLNANG